MLTLIIDTTEALRRLEASPSPLERLRAVEPAARSVSSSGAGRALVLAAGDPEPLVAAAAEAALGPAVRAWHDSDPEELFGHLARWLLSGSSMERGLGLRCVRLLQRPEGSSPVAGGLEPGEAEALAGAVQEAAASLGDGADRRVAVAAWRLGAAVLPAPPGFLEELSVLLVSMRGEARERSVTGPAKAGSRLASRPGSTPRAARPSAVARLLPGGVSRPVLAGAVVLGLLALGLATSVDPVSAPEAPARASAPPARDLSRTLDRVPVDFIARVVQAPAGGGTLVVVDETTGRTFRVHLPAGLAEAPPAGARVQVIGERSAEDAFGAEIVQASHVSVERGDGAWKWRDSTGAFEKGARQSGALPSAALRPIGGQGTVAPPAEESR